MEWWTWQTDVLYSPLALADNVVAAAPFQPGQRLYCKERFFAWSGGAGGLGEDVYFDGDPEIQRLIEDNNTLLIPRELSGGIVGKWRWRSPVTMPRWASRITLEVTSTGAGRVQEISYLDMVAMGNCAAMYEYDARDLFIAHWNADNAKYPWAQNPWNWIYGVRGVE
jgi:hypothetical protein